MITDESGYTSGFETSPAPEAQMEPSTAFAEWLNSGPDIAKAAGVEVEIVAITAEGGTLKLTSSGFPESSPPQEHMASLVQKLRGVAELKNPDTHEDFSVSVALDTLALLKGLCAEAADVIEGTPPQTKVRGSK